MAMAVVYTNFGGRLVHESRNGTERHYVSDPLGSLVGEINENGSLTYEAEYWPFGEVQGESGTKQSDWGFAGLLGYLEDSSSLLYVRKRHYLNQKARWLTVDLLWPRSSAYMYALNAPVFFTDKLGLRPLVSPGRDNSLPRYTITDDVVFSYGNYCGSNTFDDRDCRSEPLDCIDSACQAHDDCLKSKPYFAAPDCHCKLALDALKCLAFGCYTQRDKSYWWPTSVQKCQFAADNILATFLAICPITAITGFVGWAAWKPPSSSDPNTGFYRYEDRPGAIIEQSGGRIVRV